MTDRLNVLAFTTFAALFCSYLYVVLPPHWTLSLLSAATGAITSNADEYAIFVGDVLLARDVEKKIDDQGVDPFSAFHTLFQGATFVVGNFEAAIPEVHQPTKAGEMVFSVRSDLVSLLQRAGFTHLSLANNHTLDQGGAGYKNTKQVLEQSGLTPFGHQRIVEPEVSTTYVTLSNTQVALIGLNIVNSKIPDDVLKNVITDAGQYSDLQIVYIHWGEEYQLTHTKEQERVAMLLVDYGVDAVIGDHPHVVEDIAIYKDAPIFYSLGNFLFDQYFDDDVQQGLALKMHIVSGQLHFDLIPVTSLGTPIKPRIMSGDERSAFWEALQRRSSADLGNLQFDHK